MSCYRLHALTQACIITPMDTNTYWKQQWANFCPHFEEGMAKVNLMDYHGPNLSFSMLPGGGFGDLSHPTTKLCLQQLCQTAVLHNTPFIDVGCGSGVLSLAAYQLGFTPIISLDIEPAALEHTRENSTLNQASLQVSHHLPLIESKQKPLIIMNMISSEAEHAWQSVERFHTLPKTLITSGILTEDRDSYLATRPTSYGQLIYETDEDGWSLFVFTS